MFNSKSFIWVRSDGALKFEKVITFQRLFWIGVDISKSTRLNSRSLATVPFAVNEISCIFSAGSPGFAGMPKGSRSAHRITASSVLFTCRSWRIHHLSSIDPFIHDGFQIRTALAFFSVGRPLKTGAMKFHREARDKQRRSLRKVNMRADPAG